MPSPSSEGLKNLALTALDHAYSRRHAVHAMTMLRNRPEPSMDQGVLAQRKVLIELSEKLIEKEFEKDMDTLAQCWTEYRRSQR